jgi:hypothetical protein
VKNQLRSHNLLNASLSRREFLGQSAAAAMGFTIVPRRVLGGTGYVPPSDKVNIAFIGVGSQGLRVRLHFLREPDVQGIAVCDPNQSSANHPQWSRVIEVPFSPRATEVGARSRGKILPVRSTVLAPAPN